MSVDLGEGAVDVDDVSDAAPSGDGSSGRRATDGIDDPVPGTADDRLRAMLTLRVRVAGLVAVAVAAVYMVACVVYNLPSSTVKVRIDRADKVLIQPWFEQDWQLFAPTPASSNAHLVISVRVTGSSGAVSELASFDAQYPVEDLQKRSPLLPTKQPGITLAAQERFASYQQQLLVIEKVAGPAVKALHATLDQRFAPTLDALDRFISYEAHQRYPTAPISQVQATFTQTPMIPFSARNDTPPPAQKTTETLQTTWFPYVSEVGTP